MWYWACTMEVMKSEAYRRLVSRCWRNWPSWLHARTSKLGSQSMWMTRLIASNRIAFLALECCTFFDFGGSCALFSIVSMHSVSRFLTVGSSTTSVATCCENTAILLPLQLLTENTENLITNDKAEKKTLHWQWQLRCTGPYTHCGIWSGKG